MKDGHNVIAVGFEDESKAYEAINSCGRPIARAGSWCAAPRSSRASWTGPSPSPSPMTRSSASGSQAAVCWACWWASSVARSASSSGWGRVRSPAASSTSAGPTERARRRCHARLAVCRQSGTVRRDRRVRGRGRRRRDARLGGTDRAMPAAEVLAALDSAEKAAEVARHEAHKAMRRAASRRRASARSERSLRSRPRGTSDRGFHGKPTGADERKKEYAPVHAHA